MKTMKKLAGSLLCFLLLNNICAAQEVANLKYWILFSDKNNSPYSINEPNQFLSEKAIERRNNYNIPITEKDLPVNPNYITELANFPIQILQKSKWFNAVSISIDTTDKTILSQIMDLEFVSDTIFLAQYFAGKTSIDKFKDEQQQQQLTLSNAPVNTYGAAEFQIKQCNAHHLHGNGFSGQGMTVAVMDAGFPNVKTMGAFADLIAENRLLGAYDFVDNDNDPFDDSQHGTNVLSTMAAHIDQAFLGTAPQANYYVFKTEDVASEQRIEEVNWVAAAELADSLGVDVINTSLGYSNFDLPQFSYTYQDMDGNTSIISRAADMAAQTGMLVVNSAGNAGNSTWKYITAPADGDSVLTVGAVNFEGLKVGFSSFGPTADGQTKPNLVSLGQAAAIVDLENQIKFSNGTSFSSPILAGMATCLWQNNRTHSNMEIIEALQLSASLSQMPNDSLGWGIPDLALAYYLLKGEELQNSDDLLSSNSHINTIKILNSDWFTSNNNAPIEIAVFNLSGQKLAQKTLSLNPSQSINIKQYIVDNFSQLKGIIALQIVQENTAWARKIFIN